MSIYESIASVYDEINAEIDYDLWADTISEWLSENGCPQNGVILDLGCGTGSMTIPLAKRGFDMIGLDLSPDMLSIAREREEREGVSQILWTMQDMTDFSLYGMVDGVVSCLDSINHLSEKAELTACFDCISQYLLPNGIFIFDVNSQYKFETLYAEETYAFETDHAFCVWQNDYDEENHLCDFYITVFTETKDGSYEREDSHQVERYYSIEELREALDQSGFELIGLYGGLDKKDVAADDDRWYIVAKKRGKA